MILPYQMIKSYCKDLGMIEPWCERTLFEGMSYGLSSASYDFRCAQTFVIGPNQFILCSTIEKVNIPINILANVADKSSWARKGLAVQNTVFDPGFTGYPTIELTNHSANAISIKKGMPICQFVFFMLLEPTDKPYNGKYQNQPCCPVGAIDEKRS